MSEKKVVNKLEAIKMAIGTPERPVTNPELSELLRSIGADALKVFAQECADTIGVEIRQ